MATTLGCAASSTSGPGSSRPSLPASWGWMPTAQNTSGRRSASAMPTGQPARLARDVDHALDARRRGPRDHAGLVLGEARVVEVAVAVDDHAASGSMCRGNTPGRRRQHGPGAQARAAGPSAAKPRSVSAHRQQIQQLGRRFAA